MKNVIETCIYKGNKIIVLSYLTTDIFKGHFIL